MTASPQQHQRAIYCPATLQYIHHCVQARMTPESIAGDLAWTVDELQRRAKTHGIELIKAVEYKPEIAKAKAYSSVGRRLGYNEFDDMMSIDDIADGLPPRQREMFRFLVSKAGQRTPGKEIAAFLGTKSSDAISHQLNNIRSKLRNTKWTIDAVCYGRDRGYRLVTQSGRVD